MRYTWPVTLEPEDNGDGFTATFDGLPGATWGATKAEALAMAKDMLVTALSFYTDEGEKLPQPPSAAGRPMVSVPPLVAAKLALHEAMLAVGISNVDLAARLVVDEKAVRRLRDPLHRSHIGAVEAALEALGKRLVVDVVNVAERSPVDDRTSYDPEADVLYVKFGPSDATYDGLTEVAPGVFVEFDTEGNLIGMEVLSVRRRGAAVDAQKPQTAE